MANDNKYGRLYPERAVAPLRAAVTVLLEMIAGQRDAASQSEYVAITVEALDDLDRLGFPLDEPLFLLRGQDVLAPEFVNAYAQMVRDHPQASVRRLNAARIDEIAWQMDRWQPRKLPD